MYSLYRSMRGWGSFCTIGRTPFVCEVSREEYHYLSVIWSGKGGPCEVGILSILSRTFTPSRLMSWSVCAGLRLSRSTRHSPSERRRTNAPSDDTIVRSTVLVPTSHAEICKVYRKGFPDGVTTRPEICRKGIASTSK